MRDTYSDEHVVADISERTPLVPRPQDDGNDRSCEVPSSPQPSSSSSSGGGGFRSGLLKGAFRVPSVTWTDMTRYFSAPSVHNPTAVLHIFCVVVLLVSVAAALPQMAFVRIYEDLLCHRYYEKVASSNNGGGIPGTTPGTPIIAPGTPIDERFCKVDSVQSDLAYLMAVLDVLRAVVQCVVAAPWGAVADRWGRNPVFALGLLGGVLDNSWQAFVAGTYHRPGGPLLPAWALWLAPVSYVCGGGDAVLNAVILSALADVLPEGKRSLAFMRIHIANMVGNLVAPLIASAMMMKRGPWPVVMLAIFLQLVTISSVLLIPETLQKKNKSKTKGGVSSSSSEDSERYDDAEEEEEQEQEAATAAQAAATTLRTRLVQSIRQTLSALSILRLPPVALLLGVTFLAQPLVMSTYSFLTVFASKRYAVPIAETGFVQTVYGAAHLVAVLLVVPALSAWLVSPRRGGAPAAIRSPDDASRDLTLARASFAVNGLGTLMLGLSPRLSGFVAGLVVMAFGSGALSFVKSLAALYVGPHQRSALYTLIGMAQVAAGFWTMPALAALFSAGLKLGGGEGNGKRKGVGVGLPYFGVAGLCVVIWGLLMVLRVPRRRKESSGGEEGEEERRRREGTGVEGDRGGDEECAEEEEEGRYRD